MPTQKLGHHIDGLPTMNNGVEKGKVHNFTLLYAQMSGVCVRVCHVNMRCGCVWCGDATLTWRRIGVYLSDVTSENCGNFTVFPGTLHVCVSACVCMCV